MPDIAYEEMPTPWSPPGLQKGWINLLIVRTDGFELKTFLEREVGEATVAFYNLVQDRKVMFVGLYGTDCGIINNFYRPVNP